MGFAKNSLYYSSVVYEWNLPAGTTCPFARECRVSVDRVTGKFCVSKGYFRCYAASAERFPAVREHRWKNYELILAGKKPVIPKDCKNVRIHASGDFFSQEYFDMWLEIAREHPDIKFWAFTKSIIYWVKRLGSMLENFTLTASYGGYGDSLIEAYSLKSATVYKTPGDVPNGMPIDTNDDIARMKGVSFALLDNYCKN